NNAMIGRQLMNQALELDNNYSAAWTMLGWTYWEEAVFGWVSDTEKSMQKANEAVHKALAVDPPYPGAYGLLGHIHMVRDETEQAIVRYSPISASALVPLITRLGRVPENFRARHSAGMPARRSPTTKPCESWIRKFATPTAISANPKKP
ncbi:MAG: hypothetical protein IID54_04485, partial [Proteobacteria bacterium]|nr:hypothetical protein [Pseudomonadota bacterium]